MRTAQSCPNLIPDSRERTIRKVERSVLVAAGVGALLGLSWLLFGPLGWLR
jgi:hypothetical protein